MSRRLKELIHQELKSRLEGIQELVVVSVRGISGTDSNQLRGDLCEKQIYLKVISNSLAGRVFAGLGMGQIRELLTGPSAIVYGGDSIIDVAQTLVEWDKKLEHLHIKGGFLEGQILDVEATKGLAQMPNRAELQGSIVTLSNSPGSRLAGTFAAPGGMIAGCIKALIEKLEAA